VGTTAIPDRFTTLPDEPAPQATVLALDQAGIDGTLVIASASGSQELPGRIPIVFIRQQVGY
jgi:hypothetical protein